MLAFRKLLLSEVPRSPDDPVVPAPDPGAPQPPSRPDWVPEQFWDAQKNEVKGAEFGKHLSDLSTFKSAADEAAKAVPAKPEDYKIALPADFKIENLPTGFEIKIDPKDPRAVAAQQFAHKHKLTQGALSELLTLEAQRVAGEAVASEQRLESAKKALGDNAEDRITAVDAFMKANLTAKQYEAMGAVAQDADAVEAMEALIAKVSAGSVPPNPQDEAPKPPPQRTADRWYADRNSQQKAS